jgi:low temperature requirement protein LtrA
VTRGTLLRSRRADGAQQVEVTSAELFFDLVYVFAFTQLSEHLYKDLTVNGALETLVLFAGVWWSWNYTAWATNWIDPKRAPVALLMIALAGISLVMSSAIPDAFGGRTLPDRGLTFAGAYVALQLVRSVFMVYAFSLRETMGRNYAQLLAWSAIAGVAWIAGGLLHHDARLIAWAVAVVIELTAPIHGYWLPRVGGTPIEDWTLAGGHLAERCQLILMIALGESLLRLGEAFSLEHGRAGVAVAFVVGFVEAAALWGSYFLRHAEHGEQAISRSPRDAARLGRAAYAYAHSLMVAGVIVVAVAIHLTIEAPTRPVTVAVAAVALAGPLIYLAGIVLFKSTLGTFSIRPPLAAAAGILVLGVPAAFGDRLLELVAVTAVLGGLALAAGLDVGSRVLRSP